MSYKLALAMAVAFMPDTEDAFHSCFVKRERILINLIKRLETEGLMDGYNSDKRSMAPGSHEFDMARDIVATESNGFDEVTRARVTSEMGLCVSLDLFVQEWKKTLDIAKVYLATATQSRVSYEERTRKPLAPKTRPS